MISSGFPIATRRHVEAGEHCTLTTQCPENAKVMQSPGLPCDSVCHQSHHEEMWHLTSARATVKLSYLWRGFMFTVQSQASSVLWTFKDGWNTSAEPIVWSPIRKAYLFLNTVHFLNRVSASRWKKIWNSPDQIYSLPQLSISALHTYKLYSVSTVWARKHSKERSSLCESIVGKSSIRTNYSYIQR